MRVVLDTNTIISGLLWRGLPGEVFDAANARKYTLLTADELTNELERVLNRAKFAPMLEAIERTAAEFLTAYRDLAETVTPIPVPADALRDPKDTIFLGCALGGNADYLVSGDQDLLVLGQYQSVTIVSAAQFLTILAAQA